MRTTDKPETTWIHNRPTEEGFYWCLQRNKIRMVTVFCCGKSNSLFTNEDCGASLDDNFYDEAMWCGPILPPNKPK